MFCERLALWRGTLMRALDVGMARPSTGWAGALEPAWRALEAEADASFFQSWTWVGCKAASRFNRSMLVTAHSEGKLVGLALFNQPRRGGPVWLQETGRAADDAVYIEHNGPLLAGPIVGRIAELSAMLSCALRAGRVIHLSGVTAEVGLAARQIRAVVEVTRSQAAPFVNLQEPASHAAYLESLSRNTRQQLRKAERLYGGLKVTRASTQAIALGYFVELVSLHNESWATRGKPGAFGDPATLEFHRDLIARGVERDEVDLLRISGTTELAGYLYNFRLNGRVSAYQSGFAYRAAGARHKPGLSCHAAAISWYREHGLFSYDFLAGDSRYKNSLSNDESQLHWMVVSQRFHPRAWLSLARNFKQLLILALRLHRPSQPRDAVVMGD